MILTTLMLVARAQAADTYIYYNSTYISAADITDLKNALTGVGASVTTSTSTSWSTDWSGYKLVILLLPAHSFSAAQARALETMVDGGGRLVVSADYGVSGAWASDNTYVDNLMSSLGTGLSLTGDVVDGTGCTNATTIASDQVTDGVSYLQLSASNGITGGTSLAKYGGKTILAYDQPDSATDPRTAFDVILSGDVNLFMDSCGSGNRDGYNKTMWENLYTGICGDADGDGHTDDACGGDDCDDTDPSVHPGATEVPYDGIDQDCDGSDLTDVDGDGYNSTAVAGGTDCDDNDATIHPAAPETADGADEDCDGVVDEGTDWYDDDGDGTTEDGGDCNDANPDVHAGAVETCNALDDDCDGIVDEGTDCYDDDGDGYTEATGDCNDADPAVNPAATEIDGNGIDDNCDGTVDINAYDGDGDGYTTSGGDCSDADPSMYPGATETPDGKDNDCDGIVDEGTTTYDDDGDGYSEAGGDCNDANSAVSPVATEDPSNGVDDDCDGVVDEGGSGTDDDGDGYSEDQGDCNDASASVSPSATEIPGNGIDDNCNGVIDEGTDDLDGDGQTTAAGDCDDTNPWVYAGAAEMCDGVDNNCDGAVDENCEVIAGDTGAPASKQGCGCTTSAGDERAGDGSAAFGLVMAGLLLGRRRRG